MSNCLPWVPQRCQFAACIVTNNILLEDLALHMFQTLNLVILSNHGLNQLFLGLQRMASMSARQRMGGWGGGGGGGDETCK